MVFGVWSWLAVTMVVTAHSQLVFEPSTGLEENDQCHVEGGRIWRCKKDRECTGSKSILKGGGRLRTCAWKDSHTHIVCCPPETINRITESISERKCKEYQAHLCQNAGSIYEGPKYEPVNKQKVGSGRRRKRKVSRVSGSVSRSFLRNRESNSVRARRQGDGHLSGLNGTQSGTDIEGDVVLEAVGGYDADSKEFPHMSGTDLEVRFGFGAVGGFGANSKEFPHMALVGYGDASRINWQCGGSLISERFVLSAAHCSDTSYGPARWVRLGDLDISTDTDDAQPQQFEIIERFTHDAYQPPSYYNDIVLFRLDRSAVFDSYVAPTCLYAGTQDQVGVGVATGWGRNETNGPRSKILVKVYLKFIPTEVCRMKTGTNPVSLPRGLDPKTMMCAGEPGKDTCQGDSGGPLVLEAKDMCLTRQVGITSFGPKNCGLTPLNGVYVRVAHFLPWIESIVWPN